jgi:predicted MPP superfamily phosphohydrolase
MELTKIARNVHSLSLSKEENRVALLSDIHWDNPKCDREMLKRHLDYCLENQIPVFINGDFFCLHAGSKVIKGEINQTSGLNTIMPKYLDSM